MGDSPSVGYLLRNTLDDPTRPGWGGQFVRLWDARKTTFNRLTTEADSAEAFGVIDFVLAVPDGMTREDSAEMVFDGRIAAVGHNDGRFLRFRFSPRDAKVWPYVIRSRFPALDGKSGLFHRRAASDRANVSPLDPASAVVDRRSRSGGGRGRARGREERQPVARGVHAGFRRAHAPGAATDESPP